MAQAEDLVRLSATSDPGQPLASAASLAPHAPADVDRRLAVAEFRPIYQYRNKMIRNGLARTHEIDARVPPLLSP
jgi:hypothetical protein